jgi:hypothetical protein
MEACHECGTDEEDDHVPIVGMIVDIVGVCELY